MQGGYGIGFLLASAAYHTFFDAIGWRGLLMLAAAPSLIGLFIWFLVEESSVWAAHRQPRAHGTGIFSAHSKGNLITACWWLGSASVVYYSVTSLFATHMQRDLNFNSAGLSTPIMLATVGNLVGGMFWGWVSDRIGRRWALVLPSLIAIVIAPTYLLSRDVQWALVGYVVQSVFAGALSGLVPSYLTERFPTTIRATTSGFCYHQGAVWGSFVPLVLTYLQLNLGIDLGIGMLIGTVTGCVGVSLAALAGPETRRDALGTDPITR